MASAPSLFTLRYFTKDKKMPFSQESVQNLNHETLSYFFRLGLRNIFQQSPTVQIIAASHYFVHPDFNKGRPISNDIGLLKLKEPAQLNYAVNLILLPPWDDDVEPGTMCWVTGMSDETVTQF